MTARLLSPTVFASIVILATLPCHGFADDTKKPPAIFSTDISGGDLQFLTSAAELGLLQATLGVLAADHANGSDVKDYGETLAKQHSGQNERIKLLAIKKGVTLPVGLTPKQDAIAKKLSKLEGLKFDKAYLEEVVQDQQAYVAVFEQAARSQDPEIKSFVVTSLPDIKKNLELLRKMTGFAPATAAPPHFRTGTPDSVGTPGQ